MHRITRLSLLIVILGVALITGSCKWFRGNSNSTNSNSSTPKLARWVAAYRSPLSQGLSGNELSENFYYSSIAVVSPSLVFVAGDMRNPKNKSDRVGVIVKTTDGGQTWGETVLEQANVVEIRINAMAFADAETGYAVGRIQGGEGIVFKTADGGTTWTFSRVAGVNQVPTAIFMIDAETGWMGGATSIDQDEDDEGEPGGPSDLLITTDGGKTWQSQVRLPVSIYDIQFLDKQTGWASGSKGALYHTSNGGQTWEKQRTELEAGDMFTLPGSEGAKMFAISGISFPDANTGYATARAAEEDTGRVLGTTNGGEVWAKQRIVADSGARDILFLNPNEGWILTDKGSYIYHTVDGNKTWLSEKKDVDYDPPLARLGAADAQHVWAVGGGMVIVRKSD